MYHEQLLADDEIRKKYDEGQHTSSDHRQGTNATTTTTPTPLAFPTAPYTAAGEYINVSGWAGLNVGGAANGQTASVTHLQHKVCDTCMFPLHCDCHCNVLYITAIITSMINVGFGRNFRLLNKITIEQH